MGAKEHMLPLALLLCFAVLQAGRGSTNAEDASVLLSLMSQWTNTPPSWDKSDDPCGMNWDGVICSNSRVTVVRLSSMGIKGTLSGDIGQLTELRSLDLSFNNELGGPLSPSIGNLKKLTTLILAGCDISGSIPNELGSLPQLSFLALNSNKFSGKIPSSLGGLWNLYWLDLADNQLSGALPVSTNKALGLDQLLHTKHFHFNKNRLSGNIPEKLFSSNMSLIHLLFDGNQFTGEIPASLGLVQTLEIVRLDKNYLTGSVPANINNLSEVTEFNIANNKLGGPLPDLSGMTSLNYVDMSNNSFEPSETPAWFSELSSLTVLVIESGRIHGKVPEKLFSFPQLEQVILDNNQFTGTLTMGDTIREQLQIVNFRNNLISSYTVTSTYNKSLILIGNPVCSTQLSNTVYCRPPQLQGSPPYSTSITHCGKIFCKTGQSRSPQSCACAYPYQGLMVFRAPQFRDLTNVTLFQSLESSFWMKLGLTPGSVLIQNPMFDSDSYIELQVNIFPPEGMYFSRSEVLKIGFALSNQTYKPPPMFGPYYFIAAPYPFPDLEGKSSMNQVLIILIAVGCAVLIAALLGAGIYAFLQKKRARRATKLSGPFTSSWENSNKGSDGAPQLKGVRWFSFEELRKSSNDFSEVNEVGSGGYGKVYRGVLVGGELVAIKRAQRGCMQGGLEFKTEIELLSRVHHKNLVGLVGFCFEHGEQILVYEFISNGTLRDNLTGHGMFPIIGGEPKYQWQSLQACGVRGFEVFGSSMSKGYLDPEYYMSQQLTEKSDVYSFGVVMLELITARQPIERGKNVVREIKLAINRNDEEFFGLKEMIDPLLLSTVSTLGFGRFVDLAMRCVEESASHRPTMSEVVKEIESILHNDGVTTNSTSASSSATNFGNTKGAFHHIYSDSFTGKELKEGVFDYSGGLTLSTKPEPK